jgi:hypothetical protein
MFVEVAPTITCLLGNIGISLLVYINVGPLKGITSCVPMKKSTWPPL